MLEPEIAPEPRPRRRATIRLLMVLVAGSALGFGAFKSRRDAVERARVAALRDALAVAEFRMKRTQELVRRNAIPRSDVAKAGAALARIRAELKDVEGR